MHKNLLITNHSAHLLTLTPTMHFDREKDLGLFGFFFAFLNCKIEILNIKKIMK